LERGGKGLDSKKRKRPEPDLKGKKRGAATDLSPRSLERRKEGKGFQTRPVGRIGEAMKMIALLSAREEKANGPWGS